MRAKGRAPRSFTVGEGYRARLRVFQERRAARARARAVAPGLAELRRPGDRIVERADRVDHALLEGGPRGEHPALAEAGAHLLDRHLTAPCDVPHEHLVVAIDVDLERGA